jgi:MGT family glycosyltransferase
MIYVHAYNCYIYKGLPGVYPDEEDLKLAIQSTNLKIKIKTLNKFLRIILKMYRISSKYNVKFMLPFKELYRTGDNTLLLIFSIPKLQPKYEFYDKKVRKFVGACIATETRLSKADDDQYIDKCILEKKKLVYASLGSLFNAKTDVYKTIINAFKSREIQAENLYAIIATGEKAYDELETMLERKLLTLPNNVKLVRVAPQLIILQHAKLFITHSGFNSIKEAIFYGVPMICVPIAADQPLVAHHVTANLELGIKLDVNSLNEILIINSIKQILNDNRYYDRCAKCSDILKEIDGAKNFSNEILSYLNDEKNPDVS